MSTKFDKIWKRQIGKLILTAALFSASSVLKQKMQSLDRWIKVQLLFGGSIVEAMPGTKYPLHKAKISGLDRTDCYSICSLL